MLFCVQRKKQPLIRGSHKGVMTISFMGGSNLTLSPIIEVLPQNWFKTAQPLCMDDSMMIYTLFSSNVGHI
jgi:hypothetical protein